MSYTSTTFSDYKESVRAATDQALPAYTFTAGALVASSNGALGDIDDVTVGARDRILVKDETTGAQYNGLYYVESLGDASNPWVLRRSFDAARNETVTPGLLVFVEEGTANGGSVLALTTPNPIVLNTTPLTFTDITGDEAVWGQISGTLADQTDLQSALDGKADTSHTHTESDITDLGNYIEGVAWGDITGTLSTQPDLQSALDDKYDASNPDGYITEVLWGEISGTLANQTDLQGALDGKAASVHTHTESDITDLGNYIEGVSWGDVTGTLASQTDLQGALDAKYDASNPDGFISGVAWGDVTDKPSAFPPEAHNLDFHSDISIAAPANRHSIMYDGDNWENRLLVEADISDLGAYITSVSWGDIAGTLSSQGDLQSALNDKADDSVVVKLTGDQTVGGIKTFSSSPIVPAPTTDLQVATKKYVDDNAGSGGGTWGSITGTLSDQTDLQGALDGKADTSHTHTESDITDLGAYITGVAWGDVTGTLANQADLQGALDDKANDDAVVKLTGDQTVAGIKTLSSIPVLPASDPATDNQATRKKYVDDGLATKSNVSHTHTESDITDLGNYIESVSWGDIGGALSAQTDLQGALDAKYDASNPDGFISGVAWGDVTDKPSTFPPEAHDLDFHSDIGITAPANRHGLMYDGAAWENRLLVEADISDLGTYLTSVAWGDIGGTLASQTDLQGALDGKADTSHTHTESDITDLGNYIETVNWGDIGGTLASQTDLQAELATIPDSISDLDDVDTTGANNTDVLTYNTSTSNWEPAPAGTPSAHASTHESGGADEVDMSNLAVGDNVSLSNNRLINVADPVSDQDAGTKAYVDDRSVPAGGILGDILAKASGTDFDTGWLDQDDISNATFKVFTNPATNGVHELVLGFRPKAYVIVTWGPDSTSNIRLALGGANSAGATGVGWIYAAANAAVTGSTDANNRVIAGDNGGGGGTAVQARHHAFTDNGVEIDWIARNNSYLFFCIAWR